MNKHNKGPKKAKNRIRKELISFLSSQPNQPFNFKQLRKSLGVNSASDIMHLENAASQLVHEKVLEMVGNSRVQFNKEVEAAPKASNAIIGTVDLTRSGSAFVITDKFDQDVFVNKRKVLNALDGDKVEIRVTSKREGRRPEGEILKVIQRSRDTYVCTLQMSDDFAFGVPDNKRMDVDFFIPPRKTGGAKDGEKVLVRLMEYTPQQKSPVGEVLAVIGKSGEHETEMNAIMLEHGLPIDFPQKVLDAAEYIPEEIGEKELAKRRDFRDVLTFTIDPWDAKDFDDAISFQQIEEDLYEVGVHIADVTHYVKPGGTIDKEAQSRATSVYLVDRVVPMLPERLSNGLCSLRPNEDKLCFAAVFHINKNGTIKNRWFGRTAIHSDRRFTYEEAQERIETKKGDLAEEVVLLNSLAKKLRAKRFKAGAIAFDREEMRFKLDDKGAPLEIVMKVSQDAHKLIEEFMLLANREVAQHYKKGLKAKKEPPMVFRVHDKPNNEKLEGLQMMAARFGYDINLHDEKNVSKEINRLLKESKGKPEYNMLSILAIRTMAKARYTIENIGHYGLSFEHYTHFTSPIRRYPDVMVHRLLARYLAGDTEVESQQLEELCAHSSKQEVEAEAAERDSTKYKQVEYMQQFLGDEFPGNISGITENTLFVELKNKCEGGLRVNDISDDSYYFDESNYQVVGQRRKKVFKLGDEVNVRVIGCDLEKRTIELDLLV